MPLPVRALAAWCVLMAVEFIHGAARAVWLVPVLGDRASRQWGVLSGSMLIFGTTLLTYPGWHDRKTTDHTEAKAILDGIAAKLSGGAAPAAEPKKG